MAMFGIGPSNMGQMMSRLGGQNAGFWNPRAPKLDSSGQYRTPLDGIPPPPGFEQAGPMPQPTIRPFNPNQPIRSPRMPRIIPGGPSMGGPSMGGGMPPMQFPIAPSENMSNQFLFPQFGGARKRMY